MSILLLAGFVDGVTVQAGRLCMALARTSPLPPPAAGKRDAPQSRLRGTNSAFWPR